MLTFGRACLSFEREVLADEYPEKDPSTGKLIRDAIAEDVSAHKVCLCCALALSQLGPTPHTTRLQGSSPAHQQMIDCRTHALERLPAGLHEVIADRQASTNAWLECPKCNCKVDSIHACYAQGLRSNGAPEIQSPFAENSSGTLLLYFLTLYYICGLQLLLCHCAARKYVAAFTIIGRPYKLRVAAVL